MGENGILLYGADGRALSLPAGIGTFGSMGDFGPGVPLTPRYPAATPPRESQYPIGHNLYPTPRQEGGGALTFAMLRMLAKACPYFMIAVEYRKKQVRGMAWDIVPSEDKKSQAARRTHSAEIERVKAFLKKPNRIDGLGFSTWIGQLLEETLVTDATVIYRQTDRAGRLHSLVQIDGSTVKQLIDLYGHVVGYQQVLYGFPHTGYSRPIDVGDTLTRSELDYLIYTPTVSSVYGRSPIEEIEPTIRVAMNRILTQLAWHTEGNVPVAFIEAPETWTADQIAVYQQYLDLTLGGSLKERARLRVLGHGANYKPAIPFQFTKDEEEAILSQVLAHLGVPRSILVAQVNRATGETLQDQSVDTGLRPLLLWLEEYLTGIVQGPLGAPELEFSFVSGLAGDALKESQARETDIRSGVKTRNEARADIGLDPIEESEDAPDPSRIQRAHLEAAVLTRDEVRSTIDFPPTTKGDGDEYVRIADPLLGGAPGRNPEEKGSSLPKSEDAGAADPEGDEEFDPPDAKETAKAARAELGQWKRFAAKRLEKGRKVGIFRAVAIPGHVCALLAGTRDFDLGAVLIERKVRLTASVKAKAEGLIARAMERYFAAELGRATKAGTSELSKAAGIRRDVGGYTPSPAPDLSGVLKGVYNAGSRDAVDAFDLGVSFKAVDKNAAEWARYYSSDLVKGIDATTRDTVRDLIGTAVEEGWSPEKLAKALEDTGAFSAARARTIAVTETAIAQNAGQLATYWEAGVRKVHVYDGDQDEVCAAANGQVWSITEAQAKPTAHPNCRRAFSPAFDEEDS